MAPRSSASSTGRGSSACGSASCAAIRTFGREACTAFTGCATSQRGSLEATAVRLERIAERLAAATDTEAALAARAEIVECLADAAKANVQIWAELTRRVRVELRRSGAQT
jgi:hypothetical protein